MFRLQDNVPQVCVEESRDFQLFCRLFDCLFCGIKYDIDSMVNILNSTKADESMLELLCSKVGFFPRHTYDANVLKYIISAFPYIIKNKGTAVGIEYAINAILKAENNPDAVGRPYVIISTEPSQEYSAYTVYIYTTIEVYNKAALSDILSYVIPVGFDYVISTYTRLTEDIFADRLSDISRGVALVTVATDSSVIRGYNTPTSVFVGENTVARRSYTADRLIGAFDTTQVVGHTDIGDTGEYYPEQIDIEEQ